MHTCNCLSFTRSISPKMWRVLALVVVLGGLFAVGIATGVTDHLSVDVMRDAIVGAGALGVLMFIAAFAVGLLVQVPGMLFIGAAALAWGQGGGAVVGLAGAVIAVTASFIVVRSVGGKLLDDVQKPWLRKIMAKLEARPVRTIALLRLVMWLAPPLNYALAMSGVTLRQYVVGSAIGLVVPITLASVFVDALV